MDEAIFRQVLKILFPLANRDESEIQPGMSLTEDLKLYDTQLWEVQNRVEERFGLEVPLDDLELWKTVSDVVAYVASKKIAA